MPFQLSRRAEQGHRLIVCVVVRKQHYINRGCCAIASFKHTFELYASPPAINIPTTKPKGWTMNYDYRSANTYAAAFHAFKANIWNALGFAFGLLLISWANLIFDNAFAKFIGPSFLSAVFAYMIHATIIFDLDGGAKAWSAKHVGNNVMPFVFRTFIFFGFSMVLTVVFAVIGFSLTHSKQNGIVLSLLLLIVIGLPLLGGMFSIIGTMLPAVVDGKDASFKAAKARVKGQFWYTFSRLVYGPTLFSIVMIAAVIGLVALDIHGPLVDYAFHIAGLFVTTLAATVLCKTYLRSEKSAAPEEKPSAAP